MKSWLVLFVVLVCVGIVATHGWNPPRAAEPWWIETRATQIHVGPWVADIPAGWRDIHELRKPVPGLGIDIPGTRTLLFAEEPSSGQIDVFPFMRVVGEAACKSTAEAMSEQAKDAGLILSRADAATFAGDPGCIFVLQLHGQDGLLLTRTHNLMSIAIRCLGEGATLDGTSACAQMIDGLRFE